MIYDWEVGSDTLTTGEVLEYYLDGDEIVMVSNLAKNEIRLSRDQAVDVMCGLAALINKVEKVSDGCGT